MAQKQQPHPRPLARLYLTTPAVAEANALAKDLAAVLATAEVAAVLLRLADDAERALINRIKTIAPVVQQTGAALIIDGHPQIVARSGADGAHLRDLADLESALAALKPERIAGCGGLKTRHDAMVAAERGADYVMFGEPDADGERPQFEAVLDRVSWWAEVFQTPCVAYAEVLDEIAPLAKAGADFVAVSHVLFSDPRGAAQTFAEVAGRLAAEAVT